MYQVWYNNSMIITTSSRPTATLEAQAKAISNELTIPFVDRNKRSLSHLHTLYGDILLVSKDGLRLAYANGQSLSFHPDTAMLRIKAPRDPLTEMIGTGKKRILDTTMGLASDSLVMSFAGHSVTAIESQPIIHCIVARGLQAFDTGNAAINAAMRNIKTLCTESLTYLKTQPDNAYDIIYCDPMFTKEIKESANLSSLKPLANYTPLTRKFLHEAKRVASQKIILKAHFRDPVFEEFGFDHYVRPNQKFHFGLIELKNK